MLAGLCSCSDFLTREPIHKFSAETYFSSEAELEMYANGMLNSWLPNSSETSFSRVYSPGYFPAAISFATLCADFIVKNPKFPFAI